MSRLSLARAELEGVHPIGLQWVGQGSAWQYIRWYYRFPFDLLLKHRFPFVLLLLVSWMALVLELVLEIGRLSHRPYEPFSNH